MMPLMMSLVMKRMMKRGWCNFVVRATCILALVNPLTSRTLETTHDRATVLLPFVTSSVFMIKDVFGTQLSRRKKSFKNCPNKREIL